jgi:DNA-binding MarR family transcriptional regulator
MAKISETANYRSLATLIAELETRPFVAAVKALLRAAFLFVNHPDRKYQAHDLSVAELDVLAVIAGAGVGGLNCSEIAGRTLITKGGITKVLDRLGTRRLVKRIPSREDRRSISVQLSAKGVEFCGALFPQIASEDQQIFERTFRPEQISQLSELLSVLVRTLEADQVKTRRGESEQSHGDSRI